MKIKLHCSLFLSGIVDVEVNEQGNVQTNFVVEPIFTPACVQFTVKDGKADLPPDAGETSLYAVHLLLKHRLLAVNKAIEEHHAAIVNKQAEPEGGAKA